MASIDESSEFSFNGNSAIEAGSETQAVETKVIQTTKPKSIQKPDSKSSNEMGGDGDDSIL